MAKRENRRVQVNPLQGSTKLRPVASPVDTYVAPQRRPEDRNLANLTEALSSFSGSLGRFGAAYQPTKEDRERMQWAAERKIRGMTKEEQHEAVVNGTMPAWQNDFERTAASQVFGDGFGAVEVERHKAFLQTEFNWDEGDVEEYLANVEQEAYETYGTDPALGKAMQRRFGQLREWAYNYQNERINEKHVEAQHGAAFVLMDTRINDMLNEGVYTPEEIAKNAWALRSEAIKAGTLGVNEDTFEKELINKARRIAQSNPEVAMALVGHVYKDHTGKARSIAALPEYQDAVLNINATAEKALREQAEAETLSNLDAVNYERLRAGTIDTVEDFVYTDANGNEKTISADKQIENARRDYYAASGRIAAGSREDDTERLRRETRELRRAGIKNTRVEAALGGLADLVSPETIADPEALEKVKAKLKLHQTVFNESKNTYTAHIKDDRDKDFFLTYDQAKRYLKHPDGRPYTDEEAINLAFRVQDADMQGNLPPVQRDEIEAQTKRLVESSGWFSWLNSYGAGEEPVNYSDGYQRVHGMATRLVKSGLEPKKAVEMAGEAIKASSTSYRGSLLDFQGMPIPDNFGPVMDEFIGNFAEEHPLVLEHNGISANDITVMPITGAGSQEDRFRLVHRDNPAIPVLDTQGNEQFFTIKQLNERARTVEAERQREAYERIQIRDTAASRGYERDGDKWVDPKTDAYVEPKFDKDGSVNWKTTNKRRPKFKPQTLTGPGSGQRDSSGLIINPAKVHERFR